ncbi:hypothetical protein J0H58_38890 [bacterium]|nr:hypothetical protein [bacterium]
MQPRLSPRRGRLAALGVLCACYGLVAAGGREDEPSLPPRPIDPKVVKAWKAVGAKAGWANRVQFFDYRPDVENAPELLPYLSLKTFKPGIVADLPAPDVTFALYQSGTDITDAGVKELAALKTLRRLELSANLQLTGAGFGALAALPDLQVLGLYQTRVNDAGLTEVCRIAALRELDVGSSAVTEGGLAGLEKLERLQVLGVSGVKLTDAGLAALGRCRNLRALTLSPHGQTGAGLGALGALKHLERLKMPGASGPSLKDADLNGLGTLRGVRELLIMYHRDLGDAALAEVGKLTGLRVLFLTGTNVTDAGLKHLAGLRGLEELELADTRVTDASLAQLAKLPTLKTLRVNRTAVTEAGLRAIVAFESPALRSVSVPSRVSSAALEEARRQRPGVLFGY